MSSAGHILDMINRIKQNKVSRRKKFRGDNRESIYSEKFDQTTEYDFPKASTGEMEMLKLEIQQKAKANNRRLFFLLLISAAVVAFAFWALTTLILNKIT